MTLKIHIQKLSHRKRRAARTRAKLFGTKVCPRLSVFRSNKHIYAQVIDDDAKSTIVSSSDVALKAGKKTLRERASLVGADVAKKAKKQKIDKVVFDRGGFSYTGVVEALASSARKEGLKF